MTTRTHTIPESNMGELRARFEKLAKRAEKLGVPAPTFVVDREYDEEIRIPGAEPTGRFRRYFDIHVVGETPKFAGWSFIAALTHLRTDDGEPVTILACVADATVDERFRTAGPDCQHCQRRIFRSATFVVRHDDGTEKQVGRQCIRDFLGADSPEHIASAVEMLAGISGMCEAAEDESWGGGGGSDRIEMLRLLTRVAQVIRLHGWISRKQARDSVLVAGVEATADTAMRFMFPSKEEIRRDRLPPRATDADAEEAQAAIDWARAIEPRGDYEHSIQACARCCAPSAFWAPA